MACEKFLPYVLSGLHLGSVQVQRAVYFGREKIAQFNVK